MTSAEKKHVKFLSELEQEKRSDLPIWLRPVSDQCLEDYGLFKEHWRDPLLTMGKNSSQLWAQKSENVLLDFLQP